MEDASIEQHLWEGRRLIGRLGLQRALGVIWLIDAGLQAEPAKFAHAYPLGTLAQSVMGEPNWINRSIFAGIHPFVAYWPLWNLGAVLIQLVIGICLVTGRFTKGALGVSIIWALVVWWLGEGFGTLLSGFGLMAAGAPGPALLYVLLAVMAWPRAGRPDVDHRTWTVTWVTLWVSAAILEYPFSHPVGQVLQANLEENLSTTRLLASTSTWFGHVASGHAVTVAVALAVLQVTIGLGALFANGWPRLWPALGIFLSLFFWVVVQQLGGLPGTGATDPDLGPLMVVLGLAAWPALRTGAGQRQKPKDPGARRAPQVAERGTRRSQRGGFGPGSAWLSGAHPRMSGRKASRELAAQNELVAAPAVRARTSHRRAGWR